MADNVITLPTQNLSGPYIGPGLTKPDTISGAGGHSTLLSSDTNPDELSRLQPLALKEGAGDPGVGFPGRMMQENQTKSLAIHLYPNLDSGRVENMGRNPATFRIRAIFTNNIYPGQNETWTPGLLFPNTFIAVYNILLNNNNIIFQHPMLGDITVQVHSWSYELNRATAADGAYMEIELVETIGDNNPITQQVAPPPGSNLQRSALALDTAIASAPQSLNPPNLSLSQFFGQVTNLISQATSFPNNVVNSVNAQIVIPVVNGVASVGGALINAPAYTVQNTKTAIQNTKNAVLNSPIQTSVSNFENTFSIPQPNPFAPLPGVSYTQSTYNAMQSILHLNNTPSQNAFQLMDKLMRALIDLMQHYIDQNSVAVTQIIVALRALLLQVQQQQSALSLNTNNQTIKVRTYVTPTVMTWFQLSKYLNNPVDDLMGLNQGLINDFWIPAFTTISYFQS